jgi:hypothetical protein
MAGFIGGSYHRIASRDEEEPVAAGQQHLVTGDLIATSLRPVKR